MHKYTKNSSELSCLCGKRFTTFRSVDITHLPNNIKSGEYCGYSFFRRNNEHRAHQNMVYISLVLGESGILQAQKKARG